MKHSRRLHIFGRCALLVWISDFSSAWANNVKTVFVIAMENHNWNQPANQFTCGIQKIFQNPAARYINSLVNGTLSISDQVSYATAHDNVLATSTGNNLHIDPSEPNYLWLEAVRQFLVWSMTTIRAAPMVPHGPKHRPALPTFITNAGRTWKSYQEDVDLTPHGKPLDDVVETTSSGWHFTRCSAQCGSVLLLTEALEEGS